MQPISVEAFARMVMKNNKGYWAAGSAITGSNLCFTCTTGEANDSDDYEIE